MSLEEKQAINESGPTERDVLNAIDTSFCNFMYYDRKEDEDLPRGVIEELVAARPEFKQEIIAEFARLVNQYFDE